MLQKSHTVGIRYVLNCRGLDVVPKNNVKKVSVIFNSVDNEHVARKA